MSLEQQRIINAVASIIADWPEGPDTEQAIDVNSDDGWTFDIPHDGEGRRWTRYEGVYLNPDDLDEAIRRAHDSTS